jgi:hypothetical protein
MGPSEQEKGALLPRLRRPDVKQQGVGVDSIIVQIEAFQIRVTSSSKNFLVFVISFIDI